MAKQARSTGRGKLGWIAPRSGGYTPKDTGIKRGEPPTGRASSSSAVEAASTPGVAR